MGCSREFTKTVLETALNEEMTEHLGHDKNQAKPDREGTFERQIVKKRQRRLNDVDEIFLSLYAKGLTTGQISAHFAEIYGASVSKETILGSLTRILRERPD